MKILQLAPDFSLQDQLGKTHKLVDYRGSWLIVYFYPKDNTPSCTKEACQFRDRLSDFSQLNCSILGINSGNADKHRQFSESYNLTFPLLADNDGFVAKDYGALFSFGPIKITKRQTFIINPNGEIAKKYSWVNVDRQSELLLQDLQKLQREIATNKA